MADNYDYKEPEKKKLSDKLSFNNTGGIAFALIGIIAIACKFFGVYPEDGLTLLGSLEHLFFFAVIAFLGTIVFIVLYIIHEKIAELFDTSKFAPQIHLVLSIIILLGVIYSCSII